VAGWLVEGPGELARFALLTAGLVFGIFTQIHQRGKKLLSLSSLL
jgi:hypothetical protein